MDIANRVGLNASASTRQAAVGFVVAIDGLVDNPTYGLTALRGASLTARILTGDTESNVSSEEISYQWCSMSMGPIPGATSAGFTPDSGLPDLDRLFCRVTVPGQGARTAAPVTLREVPPALRDSLHDEVFDLDTGIQLVAGARAFSGLGLHFAVSGGAATVDAVTGEISIPTKTETDGAVITLTATNSGGAASTAFQVTVEDPRLEGAIAFGALTPAGSGGIAVNGTAVAQGDPSGHWQISDGLLSPSPAGDGALEGAYTLYLDNGDMLEIVIEPDKASARADEIAAVFDTLPLTAQGLLVQDGDARSIGRQRLSPRVFENEMVLEPTNWVEDPDPKQSIRPVILAGLAIGGDPSGNRATRMENLTVQGFEMQMEVDTSIGEYVFNDGIILVERPSRHVTIRQNEVWSRDLREIILADDFRENADTHQMKRGITTSKYSGINEHIRIEENYVHDVEWCILIVGAQGYGGQNSRCCNNVMEKAYRTFVTVGYSSDVDIFDNTGLHVTASLGDTTGSISDAPHAALMGFDAGAHGTTRNIRVMGNILSIGFLRKQIHEELGIEGYQCAALGVKFNDPKEMGAYMNITVAFNLLLAQNQTIEMEGASADDHILIFNNTLVKENYSAGGGAAIISFKGSENVRLWNNIASGYFISSNDNTGFFARTLDTLEGYGNVFINGANGGVGGNEYYFTGDPAKGVDQLTIEECRAAFVPKPAMHAMLSAQKKGALGHGLYLGDGTHRAVYAPPIPIAGPDAARTEWTTNGNYRQFNDATRRDGVTPKSKSIVVEFEGRTAPEDDGTEAVVVGAKNHRWVLVKNIADRLCLRLTDDTNGVLEICTSQRFPSSRGKYHVVISVNIETGRFQIMVDGVLDPWIEHRRWQGDNFSWYSNVTSFAADYREGNIWHGTVALLMIDETEIDLETDAGISLFRTTTGPRAHASRGMDVNRADTLVFIEGTSTEIAQTGAFPGDWIPTGMSVSGQ